MWVHGPLARSAERETIARLISTPFGAGIQPVQSFPNSARLARGKREVKGKAQPSLLLPGCKWMGG